MTLARPLKTPFQANKAEGGGEGGGRGYLPDTVTCHLLIKGRTCSLPQALGLTITPAAAHNNITSPPPPPHHRQLGGCALEPRACHSIQRPWTFYALCNLTHAHGALPPSVAALQGRVEPLQSADCAAQRRTGQVLATHVPRLAKLARSAIS